MTANVGTKVDCAKSAHASQQTSGPKWWRPRQPHPGTRIIRYRCFLPDLAEFANYRRGGTDGATMDVKRWTLAGFADAPRGGVALAQKLAERAGFEPAIGFTLYTLSRRAPSTTRTPLRNDFSHRPPSGRQVIPESIDGVGDLPAGMSSPSESRQE